MRASSCEEVVSEMDDHVSENEVSFDDKEDEESDQPASLTQTLLSKYSNIKWKSEPEASCGIRKSENVVKITPGPTRYAGSRTEDVYYAFMLFYPPTIMNIILKIVIKKEKRCSVTVGTI